MKPQIKVAFAHFWPNFRAEHFRDFFPFVYEKYEFVPSTDPEVIFYSVFSPGFRTSPDPRYLAPIVRFPAGNYVRVFFTGENYEPDMDNCEFAITFSVLVDHLHHLRLPLWVYENRGWGYGPERLVKDPKTDWEKVAREKTAFCNFVYSNGVPHRWAFFQLLSRYKQIDSAGPFMNNMSGWTVPREPNRLYPKIDFFRKYKFTLAAENMIWPGYMTEKLVDPMYASSIPIYVGDPKANMYFNRESYIDFGCFHDMKEMIEFVRAVDSNNDLYMKMLAAPFYRENSVPDFARNDTTLAFFDRIAAAVFARRQGGIK